MRWLGSMYQDSYHTKLHRSHTVWWGGPIFDPISRSTTPISDPFLIATLWLKLWISRSSPLLKRCWFQTSQPTYIKTTLLPFPIHLVLSLWYSTLPDTLILSIYLTEYIILPKWSIQLLLPLHSPCFLTLRAMPTLIFPTVLVLA
jgi:hypothetical protein